MNFKLNNNLTNLSKIKHYSNLQNKKVDYQQYNEKYQSSTNSYGESNNQSFNNAFTEALDNFVDLATQPILPTYNFKNFNQEMLDDMYNMSQKAEQSTNTPSEDLKDTYFDTVENFNQYIKNNVNNAGYGTREGVVAAALSLVGGYTFATGKRLRYQQTSDIYPNIPYDRQESNTEGIVNDEFYLDCSGFAWWAIYNGGYQIPKDSNGQDIWTSTWYQKNWAENNNILSSIDNGKPGDFLIYNNNNSGHIVMIIGQYDSGYYVVEFSSWEEGAQINKRSFSSLESDGYQLINMDQYYNETDNIRQK